jgi:glycosyltransferase involved in cell wall biosynthesis
MSGIAAGVGAGYQHDIYQRYNFLRCLVGAVVVDRPGPASSFKILDIGCGPVPLTETFLGPHVEIVRADVDQFGDPDITLIEADRPLPFEAGAFDLVLALDVLEHVVRPSRQTLVRECHRVARGSVILTHPADRPDVVQVEAEFGRWAQLVSGHTIEFLEEHARFGLPNSMEVAGWAPDGWHTHIFDNAPLAPWLVFNIIDYLYAYELGDGVEKRAFNEKVNLITPHLQRTGAHYRQFVCSCAQLEDALRLKTAAERERRDAPEPDGFAHACAEAIVDLHQALRRRVSRSFSASSLAGTPISTLAGALDGLFAAVGQKDAHINGLTGRAALLLAAVSSAEAKVNELNARTAEAEAQLATVTEAMREREAELATANEAMRAREAEIVTARQESETRGAQIDRLSDVVRAREEELQMLRAEATSVRPELERLRGSRGWKATALFRAAGRFPWDRRRSFRSRLPGPLARCLEIVTITQTVPLRHHLRRASKGRAPHGLFDSAYYRSQRPGLAGGGTSLLRHYVTEGARNGLDPHPLFDTSFYLAHNPDVAASGMNPLVHYLRYGAAEGRDPHPDFDSSFYLDTYQDVRASGLNPLVHYVRYGRHEGRRTGPERAEPQLGYTPPQGLLPFFNPLLAVITEARTRRPTLNILLPRVGTASLSGGPNTAFVLGCQLAAAGVRVRFVSADLPLDRDLEPLRAHLRTLYGAELPPLEFYDGHDRSRPGEYGRHDVFLATAWWTAQQAKYVARLTKNHRFVYLIQDFEPLLHPSSTPYALALETYSLDHIPVINSTLLRDYLVEQRIGRFADPEFVGRALAFQPALDRTIFYPRQESAVAGRRRLLFYARPQYGLRNLFELGVGALQRAVQTHILRADEWEFWGMGETFQPIALGNGASLVPAPWRDLAGYAQQMRESDILLSLMLSPHPSYPPLEMAASGGLVVTTSFGNKSAQALADLSANIIAVPPTLEHIGAGLATAIARLDDWKGRLHAAEIDLPKTWHRSLDRVVLELLDELALLQGPRRAANSIGSSAASRPAVPIFRDWPQDEYDVYRREAFSRRCGEYPAHREPGLISFLTTVWNTPAPYLAALTDSLLNQDCADNFEWVVLDNGSHDPETRRCLERLAGDGRVKLQRVEQNLGIIGGMRSCLERATHRYIAPLDSDDLLTPDCVRVVSCALRQAGYPALAYTDEDKLEGRHFSQPYFKPAFDPVLFANSCYIAHLGVIDRELALQLGAYTDRRAEGSHDWDTFTRFLAAGHTPLHIAEVLYSWRIHQTSTSGNIHSKPFVYDSQRAVLTRLLETLAPSGGFRIEPSPLFGGMPDWWLRRDSTEPRAITTVLLMSAPRGTPRLVVPKEISHAVVHLDASEGVPGLARLAAQEAERNSLLHILWHDTRIEDDAWAFEAMGLFELFPDTAMVGGRLHQDGRIVHAGAYFGFGRGCDAPDRGRHLTDPGYFVQAWKPHSVSAVAFDHCVIDSHFAADALASLVPSGASFDQLGDWLGAAARRQGRRVIYTPFLSATPGVDRDSHIPEIARKAFVTAHGDLMPDALLWPPHTGLTGPPFPSLRADTDHVPGEPGRPLPYEQQLDADRLARDVPESPAARQVTFTVMTGVYARSPAEPLRAAIQSVLAQTHPGFEWIVYRDGPVSPEVRALLDDLAREPRVRVIEGETCQGIQYGFRACLEAATGDWIVPIDGDDVLEVDALAVLASKIASTAADFVFSDEDHLVDGQLRSRYVRPGFDPILNLESSYIWHLSAFRRERALAVGAYTDSGAELCHDWDTSTRFAQAGAMMMHVPHVLYHWRSHDASSSHRQTQNPGTVVSTRAVLERVVAGQSSPARFEIAEYPIYRGAVEWWIRRRPVAPPSFGVVILGADERSSAVPAVGENLAIAETVVAIPHRIETLDDWQTLGRMLPVNVEYVVILGEGLRPYGEHWLWEATKWFELQRDTAIVGGRLVDEDGIVIDAGLGRQGHRVLPVYRSLRHDDAGAFALALKAQTVEAPADGFFIGEVSFLRAAIDSVLRDGFSAPFAATLGAQARTAGRRVVYSPLLEARRQRTVGRAVTTSEQVPNDGAPSRARLRLLAPANWQQIATRPEFYVSTTARDARGEVLLFSRDDFFARGIDRAACVALIRFEESSEPGVLVGMPAAPLPEGDYIVVLKESTTGRVVSVTGACLREARSRWPRRFQTMLEEQARFAGGKPADRARREEEPLFSITTAIYDVDPRFIAALADSILGQRYDDFEWVLLDNGSHRPDTQQISRELAARDPRVRFWRSEDNLHIIGGNRFLLEHARGTYVVPVDHDDVLYPDALRILSSFVAEHHEPDLLYSDEQKITLSGVASEILWRPAWSTLSALSTCPAAHLMVFKRTLALEADCYSGDYARGSPDWDSALRLATRTSHIVHVPFVLYGWRMHPGSTALNEDSKNYVAESQKSVVRHALERLDLADRFEVVPALDVLGYYHAVRRKQDGPRVVLHSVIPSDAARDALTQLRSSLAQTRYDALSVRVYVPRSGWWRVGAADPDVKAAGKLDGDGLSPEIVTYRNEDALLSLMFTGEVIESGDIHVFLNPMLAVTNADWIWEAIGTFELDRSTGIVGGCVVDPDGRVQHIGYVSGLDGFFATPAYREDIRSAYGAMAFIRRNLTAVYGSFMAVKGSVLRTIGGLTGIDRSDGLSGIEFCLRAMRHGIKTAYSPRMTATLQGQLAQPAGTNRGLAARILADYPSAGGPDPYYSRHCIPRADVFGSPIVD